MIIGRGEWNMTKNRIVKYAANTALLAVLAAAGIGVYQIGTYTPDKEIQGELQTDQSEDTEETPMVDADTRLVEAEISDTTGQNDTAEEKIARTLTDSTDSSEKTSDSVSTNEVTTETANAANAVEGTDPRGSEVQHRCGSSASGYRMVRAAVQRADSPWRPKPPLLLGRSYRQHQGSSQTNLLNNGQSTVDN